jgi:hypothetical protein
MESSWPRHASVIWRCSCRRSRFYQDREKRHEAFGANAIGRIPNQEQRMLDVRSILAKAWARKRRLHLHCMVEEPHRIFTNIAGTSDKCIKQRPFLWWGCLAVLRRHLLEQFASGLITQRPFHSTLLWKRSSCDLFAEAKGHFPLLAAREIFRFLSTVRHFLLLFQGKRAKLRICRRYKNVFVEQCFLEEDKGRFL